MRHTLPNEEAKEQVHPAFPDSGAEVTGVRNNLSAIADADDANYAAAVTTDANMNITEIDESYDNGNGINHLYTYFDVDDLNRVSAHRTKKYLSLSGKWQWTKRAHGYNGTGSLVNTTMKQWFDGDTEPAGDSLEHIYDRGRMLQNYDGTSTYGDEWRWAGAQQSHSSPLHSPNSDTASQTGYNLANDKTPQRRSFLNPTTEGDERNLYGQGKPQAKDSSGGGANWYVGTTSQPQTVQMASMESRLFFEGTVTATDMDRATDTREKGRIGITGSAQSYGGSNGRVTSEAIGRDVNPLGRGGGAALVGGMMNQGRLAPRLPGGRGEMNQGNSVNNPCAGCPGSPYGDPQQDPGNGDGGGLYDGEWIISKGGGHCVNLECWLKWKESVRNSDLSTCTIQYCQNCACTYPSAEKWRDNVTEALDDYCRCRATGCYCPTPKTADGKPCWPDINKCIKCNCNQPDSCPCDSNDVNRMRGVFDACFTIAKQDLEDCLNLCADTDVTVIWCTTWCNNIFERDVNNCCREAQVFLNTRCKSGSPKERCSCMPECSNRGHCKDR